MNWDSMAFWGSETYKNLQEELRKKNLYYPTKEKVFRPLVLTPLKSVKCVIIGQDPYHTEGTAEGLSFSCDRPFRQCPPSLRNVLKEYSFDLGLPLPERGSLIPWARQGVLLINTVWTVAPGLPDSHRGLGWEELTTEIIKTVHEAHPGVVYVLWGAKAKELVMPMLKGKGANIVHSAHPSPYSADKGFFGSRPFTKVNSFLQFEKLRPISWRLP